MKNHTFCITPTEVKSLIEENCIANTMCTIYTTTTTTIIYIVYFIDCGQTREKVGWIEREAREQKMEDKREQKMEEGSIEG